MQIGSIVFTESESVIVIIGVLVLFAVLAFWFSFTRVRQRVQQQASEQKQLTERFDSDFMYLRQQVMEAQQSMASRMEQRFGEVQRAMEQRLADMTTASIERMAKSSEAQLEALPLRLWRIRMGEHRRCRRRGFRHVPQPEPLELT